MFHTKQIFAQNRNRSANLVRLASLEINLVSFIVFLLWGLPLIHSGSDSIETIKWLLFLILLISSYVMCRGLMDRIREGSDIKYVGRPQSKERIHTMHRLQHPTTAVVGGAVRSFLLRSVSAITVPYPSVTFQNGGTHCKSC